MIPIPMKRLLWLLSPLPLLASADVIQVTTVELGSVMAPVVRNAPAAVLALNEPVIAAETSGRVLDIRPLVGDRVSLDQPLVVLDCRLQTSQLAAEQSALERIRSETAFARSQLKRAHDLKDKRSISEELVEQRQTELDIARANDADQREQVAQRKIDVERCTVRAPFTAIVTKRLASIGTLAAPGTQLLQLVQRDELELSAELQAEELQTLAKQASFHHLGIDYPVALRTIVPVIDPRTRTAEVRYRFPGDTPFVGAAGRLVWNTGKTTLPVTYVVRRDGRLGLFLADDGKARFHPLEGALEGQPPIVDLPADTRLITAGRHRLQPGDAIQADVVAE